MRLELYAHPFSSYCQKALIALYENATPFEYRILAPEAPENYAALARLWPLKKFPVLVDDGRVVVEATSIIEHLGVHHAGAVRLIPADPSAAVEARMIDRVFDNYVMTPMQRIVADVMRPAAARDATTVAEARALLDAAYGWLDARMAGREWAAGDAFGLADCAAAPSLFYADWVQAIPATRPHLRDYRRRLLARPSVARVVDEARPYRHLFPPGAPDRD
jgi:glutathione S-transferase